MRLTPHPARTSSVPPSPGRGRRVVRWLEFAACPGGRGWNAQRPNSFSTNHDRFIVSIAGRIIPDRLGIPGPDRRAGRRGRGQPLPCRHARNHDPKRRAQPAAAVQPCHRGVPAFSAFGTRRGRAGDLLLRLRHSGGLPAQAARQQQDQPPQADIDHDLMMLEPLAALDRPEVADHAIMAIAHAGQAAVLKKPHAASMHWPAIPSIAAVDGCLTCRRRAPLSAAPDPFPIRTPIGRPASARRRVRCRCRIPARDLGRRSVRAGGPGRRDA